VAPPLNLARARRAPDGRRAPDRRRAPAARRPSRAAALGALGALSAVLAVGWRACGALRVEVDGPSMLPELAPGDRLLVARARRLRAGDLVVVRDPDEPPRLLVKRVVATGGAGVEVAGDNPGASRDSRHFGPVAPALVLGRPWYRYAPEAARGLLARRPR